MTFASYSRTRSQTQWVDDLFWVCTRHIPTSRRYLWSVEKCWACGLPRPSLDFRPLGVTQTAPVPAKIVPVPVKIVATPLKSVPPHVKVTPLPKPVKDRFPGETVLTRVSVPIEDDPPGFSSNPSLPTKDVLRVLEPSAPRPVPVEALPRLTPPPKCIWPVCPYACRGESSPYCSKICSDRCGRLRRKATEKVLTAEDVSTLAKMASYHDLWSSWK